MFIASALRTERQPVGLEPLRPFIAACGLRTMHRASLPLGIAFGSSCSRGQGDHVARSREPHEVQSPPPLHTNCSRRRLPFWPLAVRAGRPRSGRQTMPPPPRVSHQTKRPVRRPPRARGNGVSNSARRHRNGDLTLASSLDEQHDQAGNENDQDRHAKVPTSLVRRVRTHVGAWIGRSKGRAGRQGRLLACNLNSVRVAELGRAGIGRRGDLARRHIEEDSTLGELNDAFAHNPGLGVGDHGEPLRLGDLRYRKVTEVDPGHRVICAGERRRGVGQAREPRRR